MITEKIQDSNWIGACYDPETDSIEGCRRNTLVWHHEDRHRQQYHNPVIDKLSKIFFIGFEGLSLAWIILAVPFGSYDLMLKMIGLTGLPHIALSTGMEIDAWLYTFRKYLEGDYRSIT